ncbi:MAG: phosphate-starvation-inducible PsiE family protein [Hyphomicrobium aestuarii]|nr:phosphate-starvation-inducible PsiE family protein [Hyphomicrobium aestuarii]
MTIEPKLPLEGVAIDKPSPNPPSPVTRAIHVIENGFLLVIAVFTVVAMGQEVLKVIRGQTVQLQDLLLMFIYVEVLGMVAVYYDSKKIPITLPLFIAITALARLVILQGKEQPPVNLIYEGGAILLLAVACVVLTWRPSGGDSTK